MSLSRKDRRELKKLRGQAQVLLEEQREVLGHAGALAQQAGRQAKRLSDTYVAPRIDDAFEGVRPLVDRGVSTARRAGTNARLLIAPVLAGALASTIRGLERVENVEAARQLQRFGVERGILAKPKRAFGFGKVFAIVAGVLSVSAVAYVFWQAFREDDELWLSPEDTPEG